MTQGENNSVPKCFCIISQMGAITEKDFHFHQNDNDKHEHYGSELPLDMLPDIWKMFLDL